MTLYIVVIFNKFDLILLYKKKKMQTIVVNTPYKVSDHHNIASKDPSIEWKLVDIPVTPFKTYEVYACEVNSEVYIKPSKVYTNREFEEIFNFGFGCRNYDENKVVWVKNAKIPN